MGKEQEFLLTNNPIKVIFKYKNNNRRTQYHVCIFLGPHAEHLSKTLDKFKNLSMFDTLVQLTAKETKDMAAFFGEKWHLKFFTSHHIAASVQTIKNNPQQINKLVATLGKKWYDENITGFKYINRTYYNFQSMIKQEREMKKKMKRLEQRMDSVDQATQATQEGGREDEEAENEEEDELAIPVVEEEEEDEDADIQDSSEASDDDIIIEEETEKNADKIVSLVKEMISTKDDGGQRDEKLEKILPFDETKNDKPYDENLKNVFAKQYVYGQYIFWDDTIKKVKQKVCAGVLASSVFGSTHPYLIPSRMYMWSEYEYIEQGKETIKRDKVTLGHKWIVRNEVLPIDVEPNDNLKTYENIAGNLRSLRDNMRRYSSRIKHENDETNILEDYVDFINNNEIYLIDIYHELGLNYRSEIELVRNLYDVYVKIYYPQVTNEDFLQIIDFLNDGPKKQAELTKILSSFQTINADLVIQNEAMRTLEPLRGQTNLYQSYFKPNFVTQTSINLNLTYISYGVSNKIDLYRIFDNFVVNDNYPFVQYQTLDTKLIFKFYQLSEETDKNIILSKWFENAPYGLSIKVRIDAKGDNKYIAVNLNENGRLDYKTQWKEEDEIEFEYIKKTYDMIHDMLAKINTENSKVRFDLPIAENFRYAFINTIQQFNLPEKFTINHNDFSDFARYFFPYVSVVIDPRKRVSSSDTQDKSKYGSYLRYKRVSKFENEARIDHRIIHFLRNFEYVPKLVAEEISKQFNITEKEALDKIEQVRTKYPVLKKTRRVLKKFENIPKYKPPGIGIDIQGKSRDNYKIRITGARSKDQLNRITNFVNILVYLYTQTYLYKRKDLQVLREKLKSLTNIAKRRNQVEEIVNEDADVKNIKQVTKLDKARVGFKPEKGQNHWTRSCQNSGKKKRQPIPFQNSADLERKGYTRNKTTGEYEKKIKIGKNEVTVKAAQLTNDNGSSIFWACDTQNNNKFVHIGFLSRSQNPNGICMPCCFKKDPALSKNKEKREYHLKCTGKLDSTAVRKNIGDKLYILQDTNKMLPDRLGFLPKHLDVYFNTFLNKTIDLKNHYLVKTDGYFLKYGSPQDEYPFLNAVASMFSLSVTDIKDKITHALTKNKHSNSIFHSLANGNIKTQFTTVEKYLAVIRNNSFIDVSIVHDVLSVPGIIYPEGLNIYVFEKNNDNNDFIVMCKDSENLVTLVNPKRANLLIIKENNNYFPIFYVAKKPTDKDVSVDRMFYLDNPKNTPLPEHIWNYFKTNCTSINLSDDKLPIAKVLVAQLQNQPVGQIVDTRNKCRYIVTPSVILPVKPSGCIHDLPILDDYSKYIKPLPDTMKELHKLQNKSYIPSGFIYEDGTVTAITFSKYIYLPVVPEYHERPKLDELMNMFGVADYNLNKLSLYDKIDNEIIQQSPTPVYDERIMQVNLHNYTTEGYQLFRLELSNFLKNNPDKKQTLAKLVEKRDDLAIRQFLYSITNKDIEKEFRQQLQQQKGGFVKIINNDPDTKNYVLRNNRDLCFSLKENACSTNHHCATDKEACVFALTKHNLVDYVNHIANELLTNETKMKEVFNIDKYYVSDIKSFDFFTKRDNQKIIRSDNNNILKIMSDLFGKDNIPVIGKKKMQRINKSLMNDAIKNTLSKVGNRYTQNIILHNAVFRAYANGFYWLKNNGANIAYRNIGYFSDLQTNLSNYFRSLVFDWILDDKNKGKITTDIEELKHYLASSSDIEYLGIHELFVLNQIHGIPVVVVDQYETPLVLIDGKVNLSPKETPSGAIHIQYTLSENNKKDLKNYTVRKVTVVYE
jgi:hypothetical protein